MIRTNWTFFSSLSATGSGAQLNVTNLGNLSKLFITIASNGSRVVNFEGTTNFITGSWVPVLCWSLLTNASAISATGSAIEQWRLDNIVGLDAVRCNLVATGSMSSVSAYGKLLE
jgi:hypothetical protein